MNRKEIILDFTSLLDVTLIVIFFFVIFSNLNNQAIQRDYEAKTKQVEKKEEQLQQEIDMVQQSSGRQGENVGEMLQFSRGDNLKIVLYSDDKNQHIVIRKDVESIQVNLDNNFEENFESEFDKIGYKKKSTILCEYIYNGSEIGSNKAYERVKNILLKMKINYKYLYISETDTSLGE